jgi:ribosomal protein L7Ae-like RNA K-turn-binding protein
MREKTLKFLGLMRRANALQVGENNTGEAVRSGKAKLLLLAEDASDNARKRAESFVGGRSCLLLCLPFSKEELSSALGLGGCSMAAVTDLGFANALMKELAARDPARYGETAQETERRCEKAERRRKETAARKGTKKSVKRKQHTSMRGKKLSAAYKEGYDKGYDDGEDDAVNGSGYEYQFDDETKYKGQKKKDFQIGYAEGYEAGYDDNMSEYHD